MKINELTLKFEKYLIEKERSEETRKGYLRDLKKLKRYLEIKYNGAVYIEEITLDDLEDFFWYLKNEKKLEPKTRNRALYAIRALFKFAKNRDYIREDISKSLEPASTSEKISLTLSEEEVKKFAKATNNILMEIVVIILYYTGMRISELLNLRIQDVDFVEEYIKINGKGKKQRMIPINAKLKPVLEDYLKNKRPNVNTDYLIATEKTGRLSKAYVNQVFVETRLLLNLDKKVTPHTLRHSFATELVRSDANLSYVQKLLGHENLDTTTIYIKADYNELNETVNLI